MIDQYIKRCVIEALEDAIKRIKSDTYPISWEKAELLFNALGSIVEEVEAVEHVYTSDNQSRSNEFLIENKISLLIELTRLKK